MRIIGHRGYPARYPENTVAGFLAALLAGAHGVELDVWLTRDNHPVVIHDPTTGRTGDRDLDVREATLRQLRELDLGMAQRIPTLEETLQAIPRGYTVMIEIKTPEAAGPSYHAAKKLGRLDDIVFISTEPEALEEIRSLDPEARIGFTIDSVEDIPLLWQLHRRLHLYTANPPIQGVEVVGPDTYWELVKEARRAGMKIALWTVDNPEEVRGHEHLIDYLITNDPLAWIQHINHPRRRDREGR